MRPFAILGCLAALLLCSANVVLAGGGHVFKPSEIASNSDVVVVAEIQGVKQIETKPLSNPKLEIAILVKAVLKGEPKESKAIVFHSYDYKSSPMELKTGDTGVMFLKLRDGKLVLTDHGAFAKFTDGFFYE